MLSIDSTPRSTWASARSAVSKDTPIVSNHIRPGMYFSIVAEGRRLGTGGIIESRWPGLDLDIREPLGLERLDDSLVVELTLIAEAEPGLARFDVDLNRPLLYPR